MRIALDVSSMLPPRTGVGAYTLYLTRALLDLDACNEYVLFANSLRRDGAVLGEFAARPNVEVVRRRIPGGWLHRAWKGLGWPPLELLTRGGFDLFHTPSGVVPPMRGAPALVVNLHDCWFLRHPERTHPLGGGYLYETLPERLPEARAMICLSDFTREEAFRLLGDALPGRVPVVHPGVDRDFFRPVRDPEALEAVRVRQRLPREFILTVGTREPRKNLETALRAAALLRRMASEPPILVCAGMSGFQEEGVRRLLAEEQLGTQVYFPGFVAPEDMPGLYSLALAVVAPAWYEGFGLTLLEAMACGCPVVASDIPAHREAGGDACLYAPPDRPERFASLLERLVVSPAERLRLGRLGVDRAREFSWREAARRVLGLYEEIAAEGRS